MGFGSWRSWCSNGKGRIRAYKLRVLGTGSICVVLQWRGVEGETREKNLISGFYIGGLGALPPISIRTKSLPKHLW